MHHLIRTNILLVAVACAGTAQAHGPVECGMVPETEWKTQTDLRQKLIAEGWKVRKVKTWNSCYEVYGVDAKGTRTEAFFNPKTFERVQPAEEPAEKK